MLSISQVQDFSFFDQLCLSLSNYKWKLFKSLSWFYLCLYFFFLCYCMHFRCVRHCQRTKVEDEILLTSVFVCVYKTIKHSWGWIRQASRSAYRTKWWGNQGTVTQTEVVNTEALNKSRIFNSWEGEEGTDRKGISEKTTPWKKQRDRGLNAGVYKLRPAHRRQNTNAGEVSPATPQLCSWRENASESSWYCFKHTGFEIQFKIKMRNSAGLLWSPHVPREVTSLSRSTLCKYMCSLFKRCEGQAAPAPAALVITCTALSTLPALTHPIRTAPL